MAAPADFCERFRDLLEALMIRERYTGQSPVAVLAAAGRRDPAMCRALVQALQHDDSNVRRAGAGALVALGSLAVPHLLQALDTDSLPLQEGILRTLALMGRSARSALGRLRRWEAPEELRELWAAAIERLRPRPARRFFYLLLIPGFWFLLALWEIADEVLSWIGFFAGSHGLAEQIALAWSFLGALLGAVVGYQLCGSLGLRWGAKYVGLAGFWAGAMVGHQVGLVVAPLSR